MLRSLYGLIMKFTGRKSLGEKRSLRRRLESPMYLVLTFKGKLGHGPGVGRASKCGSGRPPFNHSLYNVSVFEDNQATSHTDT